MARTQTKGSDIGDGAVTAADLDLSTAQSKTDPTGADCAIVVDAAAPTALKKITFTSILNWIAGNHTHTAADSGVTAGSYMSANLTVNAKGVISAASNGSAGTGANLYLYANFNGL